jgi:tetratricopeptide (TPR) repeat protein
VRSPEAQALGHFSLGYLEVTRGRWRRGFAEVEAARGLHPAYAMEYDALLRLAPMIPQSPQDLEALVARLSEWQPPADDGEADPGLWLTPHRGLHPPLRDYLLGLVFARLGRVGEAGDQAARLERCFGKQVTGTLVADMAASVRAHAQHFGDDRAPVPEIRMETSFYLTLWSPFLARTLERYARARWLQRDGQPEEALRWYASFSQNSIFDLVFLAPSHFRRGEIQQQLGNNELAAGHYMRFLELWSDCDAELEPQVEEANQRLLRL